MASQWLLVAFTLFACLGAGVMAVQACLALAGKGESLSVPAIAVAVVCLVASAASFMARVQHWERFFKVFSNLGSGITQAVLAVVVLLAVAVVWAVVLKRYGETPRPLAAVAALVCVLACIALGRYHATPTRTALSWGMAAFYVVNAGLLGACALWVVAVLRGRAAAGEVRLVEKVAAVCGVLQLAACGALVALAGATPQQARVTGGVVLDPTRPGGSGAGSTGSTDLAGQLLGGSDAPLFWAGAGLAVVALAVALAAVVARGRARAGVEGAGNRARAGAEGVGGAGSQVRAGAEGVGDADDQARAGAEGVGDAGCVGAWRTPALAALAVLCAVASSALVRAAVYTVCFNNLALF